MGQLRTILISRRGYRWGHSVLFQNALLYLQLQVLSDSPKPTRIRSDFEDEAASLTLVKIGDVKQELSL